MLQINKPEDDIDKDMIIEVQKLYTLGELKSILLLGNNENIVFDLGYTTGNYILRIKHEGHRTAVEVNAEMEYLRILSNSGASVVKVIKSSKGKSVEKVNYNGESLLVTIFEKINGEHQESDLMNGFSDQQLFNLGVSVGKIHSIAQTDIEINKLSRQHRLQDDIIRNMDQYLGNQGNMIKIIKKIIQDITILGENGIGLVHTDIRPRNQSYLEKKVVHYDFDDITFHYFMYDIAVTLFHGLEGIESEEERTTFTKRFFETYLIGYMQEFLIKINLHEMMNFMKLRCAYAIIDYYKKGKINPKTISKMRHNRHFWVAGRWDKNGWLGLIFLFQILITKFEFIFFTKSSMNSYSCFHMTKLSL